MRLNESELGEYCRRKGLYIEQVPAWRGACEQANATLQERNRPECTQAKDTRTRIRELEREGKRDKAALAEATGLLLGKKSAASWGKDEDD